MITSGKRRRRENTSQEHRGIIKNIFGEKHFKFSMEPKRTKLEKSLKCVLNTYGVFRLGPQSHKTDSHNARDYKKYTKKPYNDTKVAINRSRTPKSHKIGCTPN